LDEWQDRHAPAIKRLLAVLAIDRGGRERPVRVGGGVGCGRHLVPVVATLHLRSRVRMQPRRTEESQGGQRSERPSQKWTHGWSSWTKVNERLRARFYALADQATNAKQQR